MQILAKLMHTAFAVSCIKIIKPGIFVIVIASVTNVVAVRKVAVGLIVTSAVSVCIVLIFYHNITRIVKYTDDICTFKKRVPPKRHP